MLRFVSRAVAVGALGLAALLGSGLSASATPTDADPATPAGQPSAQDLRDVRAVTATDAVRQQLGAVHYPGAQPRAAATPAVSDQVISVYELGRDFTAGVPGAPVGQLAYVAVPATTGQGAAATLWAARTSGAWQVVNIASGDRERAVAGKLPAGAFLLHEPQVDAWYAVRGDQVTGLDPVTPAQSLADYQHAVRSRYGDKQAGSDYARQGRAGGYDRDAGNSQLTGAQRGGHDLAASRPDAGDGLLPVLLLGGGLLAVAAAAGLTGPIRRATTRR